MLHLMGRFALFCVFAVLVMPGTVWPEEANKTTKKDAVQEIKEAAKATKEYTMQQKEEYVKQAKVKLDELSRRIDALEKQIQETKGDSQAALQEKLQDLKKKRTAAINRLEELKSTTSQAWSDLKSGPGYPLRSGDYNM